jgi:hypothetical protein
MLSGAAALEAYLRHVNGSTAAAPPA